jgi:phage terminase large subunit-like protein
MDPTRAYAEAVVSGQIVAGKLVRLACERHLRDLKDGPARGLRFDGAAAQRALDFFGFLRLADGQSAGQPFHLQAFQQFIVGSLFGWKGSDGFRRFRTAYVETSKGSGKSPLSGGIGLYGLVADKESGAEIYSAAVTREQAGILFRDAKRMAEASPALAKRLEIGQHNIALLKSSSYFRPVSSEHRGLDGKRVHMALIDEVHEHPTSLVVDKMRAGTKARRQALIFLITNSGYDRTTVCWQCHEYSSKILNGLLEDDSWFAYVCQLDPCERCEAEGKVTPSDSCPDCDSWKDERVWLKANPGLDTILPRKYVREQVREAEGMPAKESIVRRLNFCQWMEASVNAIPMAKWDACKREIDWAKFDGQPCYGALDIGATSDFTAAAFLFPHDDAEAIEVPVHADQPDGEKITQVRRSYTVKALFWLPANSRKRDERMQGIIEAWRRQGLVRETPGDVVDYDQVLRDLQTLSQQYDVQEWAFDRGFQGAWFGTKLLSLFGDNRVFTFPQGIISMNAPFRELVELIIQGRLYHDGDPVLRWMASNTVAETRGGLIKPSKEKSTEKIDGIAAATMGLGRAMLNPDQGSVYDKEGITFI